VRHPPHRPSLSSAPLRTVWPAIFLAISLQIWPLLCPNQISSSRPLRWSSQVRFDCLQNKRELAPPFGTPTHRYDISLGSLLAQRRRGHQKAHSLTLTPDVLDALQLTPTDSTNDQQSQPLPAVRFKSTIEEIALDDASAGHSPHVSLGNPCEVTPEQLRDLSKRLKACPLQERRMNIFNYEAFSLPPSRVRNTWTGSTPRCWSRGCVSP